MAAAAVQAGGGAAADQGQWRVTWTENNEPPVQDVIRRFRRAWAMAVAPARIEWAEDRRWVYLSEAETWALFADGAVQEAQVAHHPDGRTVTLARM